MANEPKVFVFAYGSNMCLQRMRSRVSTAIPVTIGYVRERKFVLRKRSVDGSAKADAAFTASPHDRVWGVVYQLLSQEKPLLDQHEFLGVGYDEEMVEVVHEDGLIGAWMYMARPNEIDASLLPYSWYHDLIIDGACRHRLPDPYVEFLRSFHSVVDPNAERHSANRQLLRA